MMIQTPFAPQRDYNNEYAQQQAALAQSQQQAPGAGLIQGGFGVNPFPQIPRGSGPSSGQITDMERAAKDADAKRILASISGGGRSYVDPGTTRAIQSLVGSGSGVVGVENAAFPGGGPGDVINQMLAQNQRLGTQTQNPLLNAIQGG